MAQGGERLDGHFDRGSLPGPADGQISDRDHAARQRARLQDAPPVEPLARPEQAAVAATGDREHPCRSRPEPLFPTSDEALAGFHVRAPG